MLVLGFALLPLLTVEIPGLVDYLNHLARWHVLLSLESSPEIAGNYMRVPTLAPYLLLDAVAVPLARLVGVYLAGKLLVLAIWAGIYLGVLALHRALYGAVGLWPALSAVFLWNHGAAWGFMSFQLGVAVFFFALAAWIASLQAGWAVRLAIVTVAGAALYLSHMLMLGVFAVVIVTGTLGMLLHARERSLARWADSLAPMLLPLAMAFMVYFLWLNGITAGGAPIEYRLAAKISAVVSPFYFYKPTPDILLVLALMTAAMGFAVSRVARLRITPSMRLPLIAFLAVAAAMPVTLFGVWGVDFRLSPVLVMLAIAVVRPEALTGRRKVAWAGAAAIFALLLVRLALVWPPLATLDSQLSELRSDIATIDPGAKVLVTLGQMPAQSRLPEIAYWHAAHVAVIERDAFVPFLFTLATQIRPTPATASLDTGSGHPLLLSDLVNGLDSDFISRADGRYTDIYHRIYWARWPERFDYLLALNPRGDSDAVLAHLHEIERGSFFVIYRIRSR